ncbi:MAG: hypothetical protein MZW92_36870 [Comamonadaceae bacterium]|nr:hypothetical protein [Comamonadaceae bacterium]
MRSGRGAARVAEHRAAGAAACADAGLAPARAAGAHHRRPAVDRACRCATCCSRCALARHSAAGWDNAALPDDVRDIAELLHLGEEPTRRLLLDIDAET